MKRFSDWPERLSMFLVKRDKTPMEWGKSDCVLLMLDGVQASNGEDLGEKFNVRGRYTNMRQAFKLLKKFAGGGVEEAVTEVFLRMGYDQIPVEKANSGDPVLLDIETEEVDNLGFGLTGGFMISNDTAVVQGRTGLLYIENPKVMKAWAI
jgi:hypothetical protein